MPSKKVLELADAQHAADAEQHYRDLTGIMQRTARGMRCVCVECRDEVGGRDVDEAASGNRKKVREQARSPVSGDQRGQYAGNDREGAEEVQD